MFCASSLFFALSFGLAHNPMPLRPIPKLHKDRRRASPKLFSLCRQHLRECPPVRGDTLRVHAAFQHEITSFTPQRARISGDIATALSASEELRDLPN
jgi:hypothetical protein